MIDEPLVTALAGGEAVAFAGAGASIPSGLPLWRDLLKSRLKYAETLSLKFMPGSTVRWPAKRFVVVDYADMELHQDDGAKEREGDHLLCGLIAMRCLDRHSLSIC